MTGFIGEKSEEKVRIGDNRRPLVVLSEKRGGLNVT
jgi:hypothetical protein